MKQHNIFESQKVAVLGLGIEGKDAIHYLLKKGAYVTVLDKKDETELDFSGVDKTKIKVICGEGYLNGIADYDYLVRSPGIYRYSKEIVDAEKLGVKITSAVKIFFSECKAKTIGVTGTKGKGTTCTLIYEILKSAGKKVYLAGNIGKPYLELLDTLTEKDFVVMELSSFQLMDLGKAPNIAVILNITQDHMDWHKDIKEYIDAKRNIVLNQSEADVAIINSHDEVSKSFAKGIKSKVKFFSKTTLEENYKIDRLLKGEHNLENIAAAVCVAKHLGIDENILVSCVKNFKGLEHRLEKVDTIEGISFYNDSFATGPQPTIAAINSFSESVTLIIGGSDKGLDYGELLKLIEKKGNVKNIILIGDVGQKLFSSLQDLTSKGKTVINMEYSKMEEIVKKAMELTPDGGIVLLSPAAASFDMFKSYKDRGNQFKEAVGNLKNGK